MRAKILSMMLAAMMMLMMAGAAAAADDETSKEPVDVNEGGKETATAPEETATSATASVSYMSRYVSRGQVLSRSGVIQPSIDLDYHGLSMNVWANYDTDRGAREINETDVTLSYNYTIKGLTMSAGYSYLGVLDANTEEAFVSASYDTLLTPTLTYYQDLRLGKAGGFAILSISQESPEIWHGITVGCGAQAGYNFKNATMGTNEDGRRFNDFYNGEVSMNVNIPVTKAITIAPMIAYDFPLSKDARHAISDARRDVGDGTNSSILWGGVTVSVGF